MQEAVIAQEAVMTWEELLAYCLAKPGAWHDEPWEGDVVVKVGPKIFAFLGSGHPVGLKCGPTREAANEWLLRYPDDASVMAYIGRSGWNSLRIAGADPRRRVARGRQRVLPGRGQQAPEEGPAGRAHARIYLGRRGMTQPGPAHLAGRAWLAALPGELAAQRHVMAGLIEFCEATPLVTSLSVGCSLGRGAADALSDIDAALGIDAERGNAGAGPVRAVEAKVVAALPGIGTLVDVLRHRVGSADRLIRRIFAQFADGTQLDLAVVAEAEVRRGDAAPDFVPLYQAAGAPDAGVQAGGVAGAGGRAGRRRAGRRGAGGGTPAGGSPASDEPGPAYAVTGEQVREWAFLGWCALIDADKYLRRGSLWEAHNRLHEARHHIWVLWAAATGALYPWHGLSQVLDHDPRNLPPGIESTVTGLDPAGLRRAARASAALLTQVSASAAQRHPVRSAVGDGRVRQPRSRSRPVTGSQPAMPLRERCPPASLAGGGSPECPLSVPGLRLQGDRRRACGATRNACGVRSGKSPSWSGLRRWPPGASTRPRPEAFSGACWTVIAGAGGMPPAAATPAAAAACTAVAAREP